MHASNSALHRSAGLAMLVTVAAFLGLGVSAGEAGAKASFAGTLSGSTSQGNPGRIMVSSSGRTIKEASITVAVRCPVGVLLLPQKVRSISVTQGGRFKATLEDTSVEEGVTLHLFESFSGRFNADRTSVVAKSRIRLNFENPDGSSETCDSGTVTLHASR